MSLVASWPEPDHAAFGPTERKKLTRFERIAGATLTRNWQAIPHVTQHDEADITELTTLRKSISQQSGVKVTALAFLMKAVASALQAFPRFNASLDACGETLTLKQYFNIGFAVDTPRGLLVPVVRDVDTKSVQTIAQEIADVAKQARSKGLSMDTMSGGCFSISSLGAYGGTAFTPIINAPEVAILGASKSHEKPVRSSGGEIIWREMLPLSLSYDHRVINGVKAAQFCQHIAQTLKQPADLLEGNR